MFKETFQIIGNSIGEDAWRHFKDEKHKGSFSVYIYETISVGIAVNIDYVRKLKNKELLNRIIDFKQTPEFINNTGAGANVKSKLRQRIEFAHSFFSR